MGTVYDVYRENNGNRFEELKRSIETYEQVKGTIKTGLEDREKIARQKARIMERLGATEEQWKDYRWQLKNRFTRAEDIAEMLGLSAEETDRIKAVGERYRFAISPYYLSVIDPDNPSCGVRRQAIPSFDELNDQGELDPMDEAGWTPEELITRRYPDRLIIKVTNICGMYCRFCQRRRMIGEHDAHADREQIGKAIDYVRKNKEIRDVLITGGDAFMHDDATIEWMLEELRSIPHVEIIRFGTRAPVTLPQRITDSLVNILKKYHPIYVNTHFNNPREITEESKAACEKLANAGIPLGNQMVLLNGVNNDKYVVCKLNQALLTIRVKPYYIFHPKTVKGTSHFWVRVEEGLEIMDYLRGRTSGMAVPTYIVNGPKGLGKTPILPNYLCYIGKDKAVFRSWQGKVFTIQNEIR
ncbi:MAG TPA: KamA family radical SAM protein [Thermoclostridium caenicola]|uniref:Glutamate 2,3-aminomutase n=1 Tax=Thermoclostridium caenicola TaxID=659425 RepID=A0A1M6DQM1_9FIRM|nr:KamA family radical SAM protein [Thermoclostridium caenicola]SHI75511.1 glutamate 2,3-aminomutase [Thermoclostridium caenicola]HOK43002.1 KamA family radical SAM protein [Thermoclostridium caenicola]HOL85578.1 KamA family radical SAM protein [Thermoclostridium caenicola]HOP73059.1 KamA family radical SAM protein [Thermoclostridium caenicola]HPO76840.1 KamA family radical SAM protein [Thermoclostridium caenicola]